MDSRIQPFAEKMRKTYESMEEDFKTVRAGRANPAVLSRVRVEYYGSEVPVSQVGNITVPEARILQIAPWEPSMVKAIIKAINMSDIGINPTTDGKVIRLIFPELTEERRKELSKEVKKKGEAAKVAIRRRMSWRICRMIFRKRQTRRSRRSTRRSRQRRRKS